MEYSEKMQEIIDERQEIAFSRIKNDPFYKEVCFKQKESREKVDEILKKWLDEKEYDLLTEHQEGESFKNALESNEVYHQGMRGALGLSMIFGIKT